MRLASRCFDRRGGVETNPQRAGLLLQLKGGDCNRVALARLPVATVETPAVPRANHIFTRKLSIAQRPANMEAAARDGAEFAVLVRQRQRSAAHGDLLEFAFP